MKTKIFISLIVLAILVTACGPVVPSPTPSPIKTEKSPPPPPVAGMAVVQSVDIQILGTQPTIQVNVIVRGQLPDAGCTSIEDVTQSRDGNTFNVTLTTTTDPRAKCAQALTPFEQIIALETSDLSPAPYEVNANGVRKAFLLLPRDMPTFRQMLVDALNAQDYDTLRLMMDKSLTIALWKSEGSAYAVEPAIEQLKINHLTANASITAEFDKDLASFPAGTDPFSVMSLDVGPNHALFVSGWGPEGKDEAILYMNYTLEGTLYWHGVLVAKDGFTEN